jgi:pimeloyl-ACP methyl ester carboxylesterase
MARPEAHRRRGVRARHAVAGVVEAGGHRLASWSAGAGPPVLLLHGGWSDGREWWPQLDGLADEFTVIAWDAPGCGGSSDPPEPFAIADYADAAAALVGALDLGPVHVVGLSFGGALAMEVQRRHPDLVRSLVLASAYAGWSGSLPPDVVAERRARALAEAERPPQEWAAGYLAGFFATPVDAATSDEVLRIMHDCRSAGLKAMVRAFADADLRDALPGITVATLLLYGERDERAPLSVARGLHAAMPHARLVVLPDVGHCTNLEAPDAFNDAVRAFLRNPGA